jgi:predicted Zn-dependent protease
LKIGYLIPLLLSMCLVTAQADLSSPDAEDASRALLDSVVTDFRSEAFDSALAKLIEIEKEKPHDPEVLNMLGSVYMKKKDFVSATKYFDLSLNKKPGYFPAAFNYGELLFLQKKHTEARRYYQMLAAQDPANELLQFKLALCDIEAGDDVRAKNSLKNIKYPGDSPAWYYAQAVWEYRHSNPKKARAYTATAKSIFGDKTLLFDETFNNIGLKP